MDALLPQILAGLPFLLGFLLFVGVLIAKGGLHRHDQLETLKAIFADKHGPGPKRAAALGLLLMAAGAVSSFAVVSAKDAARAQRCRNQCAADGYARGRIGPNADRDPNDRAAWFVACICEDDDKPPRESRAE